MKPLHKTLTKIGRHQQSQQERTTRERERESAQMMTTSINQNIEDQMFISQLCPGASTQLAAAQQGESKRKRRRKKSKRGENESEGSKKRKLSAEQVKLLEMNFRKERKLESERKDRLASELDLDPRQVAVWFQNRRARWKNKKLEEEYSQLKMLHETVVLDKCHLQSEVIKLKEELSEAGKEIKRLSEKVEAVSSNSPCSSLTVENMDPPFLGEFGVEYEDVFYMPETNYMNDIDWFGLCM